MRNLSLTHVLAGMAITPGGLLACPQTAVKSELTTSVT